MSGIQYLLCQFPKDVFALKGTKMFQGIIGSALCFHMVNDSFCFKESCILNAATKTRIVSSVGAKNRRESVTKCRHGKFSDS
jgi:hypothetical protein